MIRLLRTVLTLRPRQVTGRLVFWFRWRRALSAAVALAPGASETAAPWPAGFPPGPEPDLADPGALTLLNDPRRVGWPPGWLAPDMPLLWRFRLHGLEWIARLPAELRPEVAREWVAGNQPRPGPAWHPHPTSRRIAALLRWGLGSDPVVASSLQLQAAFLHRCVERHVMGNHLLDNARALVLAGLVFRDVPEAHAWLANGLGIYRAELPSQILPDGGHEERSPMYHALVLEGLADCIHALAATGEAAEDRAFLEGYARRMAGALAAWCLPDGEIPLLNDSAFGVAPHPALLLRWVEEACGDLPDGGNHFPSTGIFVHRGPRLHLVWDAGPGGPRHLMAHAHADVFSFELAVDGVRFVVDPGVSTYEVGAERDFLRSTPAHATVSIDGGDQFECWHAFRVARRAEPREVGWEARLGQSAFRGVYPWGAIHGDRLLHRREIVVDDGLQQVRIVDQVTGNGTHMVEAVFPLAPGVEVRLLGQSAELECEGVRVEFRTQGGRLRMEDRWVAPEFGLRVPSRVLVLWRKGAVPVEFDSCLRVLSRRGVAS